MSRVSVRWSAARDGNIGIVREEHIDRYGDVVNRLQWTMPANTVPAFIQGRRRIVAMKAQEAGASFVDPDYSHLKEPLQ